MHRAESTECIVFKERNSNEAVLSALCPEALPLTIRWHREMQHWDYEHRRRCLSRGPMGSEEVEAKKDSYSQDGLACMERLFLACSKSESLLPPMLSRTMDRPKWINSGTQ